MSAREKEERKSSSTLSPYKRSKQALISVKRSSLRDQLEVIYSIHIKTQSHFPALHSSYSGESFQKEMEANRERDGMKRGAQGKDVKGYEGRKGAGKEEMGTRVVEEEHGGGEGEGLKEGGRRRWWGLGGGMKTEQRAVKKNHLIPKYLHLRAICPQFWELNHTIEVCAHKY